MPMLFPDGHLPSARWRPVAAVVVVGVVMGMLGHALVVWPLRDTLIPLVKNFMAGDQPGLGGMLASIGDSIMFLVASPVAIASLVMRYRRSTGVSREQLRWLTFTIVAATTVTVASQLVNTVVPAANAVAGIAVALVPIALTAAILRYHLYDIDRIISRTLAYAVVTSLLGGGVRREQPRCSRPSSPTRPARTRSRSPGRRSSSPRSSSRSAGGSRHPSTGASTAGTSTGPRSSARSG